MVTVGAGGNGSQVVQQLRDSVERESGLRKVATLATLLLVPISGSLMIAGEPGSAVGLLILATFVLLLDAR
jgi:hypothetical protein